MPNAGCARAAATGAERFAELDGLRGLAALMVALAHYVLAFQPALLGGGAKVAHFAASIEIGRSPLILLYNPELGVAIFFTLSGFVLAASMARVGGSLFGLVLRRWVRLALPILGTSLLIWPLAQFHLFASVQAAGLAKSDWLAGNYAWVGLVSPDLGVLVWQSLFDIFLRARHWFNSALWTMPTEFWGSVALFAGYTPLRLATGAGGWPPWVAVLPALIVLGYVWKTGYFGFPCGVLLLEAFRALPQRLHDDIRNRTGWPGLLVLGIGVVLGGMPYSIDLAGDGPYAWLFTLLAGATANPVLLSHRVGAVFLVAAALFCRPFARLLRGEACQFLGQISFMLYLVHVPLLCSPIAALLLRLAPLIGYNAATDVLLPVFLGLAAALAGICTLAFGRPAQRLSRQIGPALLLRLRRPRPA
jgi:peptidoglycan/LPS O-acetylase OafA/YrhL